ncbi:hypothetical protein A2W13_02770 [Candidatus Woesebacteria bacterium RBG_16_36_11]|uniref:Uncharacterized protein n=3 Tax=Candidatus Woeseibacteriota TaxID=1752722 RepID=A0A1F7X7Q2_9BACT|nr:MAG: hypothetical protein A2Z67_05555 [Candidatus Woesebacteria bacterium RBG_13_36_22]OGM11087.1 MAG: hypothetical protein A2W13_02770 [Candidatus Woesebacteria bacterium RBG_16_36_11]OGM17148.1 MAG: hypothetical protein A2V55_00395 [Candidatus Woesebacteria bacterium RBG_19FT_COMBO_37_29]
MIREKVSEKTQRIRREFAKQILNLMTSAFGLVAALAWNEFIKELIDKYISPFFGESSGLISKLIYALLITLLAVLITYNLSRFAEQKD